MDIRVYKFTINYTDSMRIKSTIIALLLSVAAFGQIDDAVKNVVTKEIREFGKTLDSVFMVQKAAIGTFYIDTLLVKEGTAVLFELTLTGVGTSVASAKKYAVISNIDGRYTIVRNLNPVAYSGYTGSKWDLLLVNGLPMVRITSPNLTKWEYKRY